MNCTDVENAMAPYVTGDLSSDRADDIAQHILTCDSCLAWHDEVLQLSEEWSDDRSIPDIDLVTPVLAQLNQRSLRDTEIIETSKRPLSEQKSRFAWNNRLVFLHYGVAAVATIALFQLGVFQHVGQLANAGTTLSNHMDRLIQAISSL